jgi:hypothetical protein
MAPSNILWEGEKAERELEMKLAKVEYLELDRGADHRESPDHFGRVGTTSERTRRLQSFGGEHTSLHQQHAVGQGSPCQVFKQKLRSPCLVLEENLQEILPLLLSKFQLLAQRASGSHDVIGRQTLTHYFSLMKLWAIHNMP